MGIEMIKVCKAKQLPHTHPLHQDALPDGFPFLITGTTEEIVEPVFNYLYQRYIYQMGNWCANTVEAVCYDLLDWFNFLNYKSLDWIHAEEHELLEFRNALLITTSPRSHRKLSSGTINRRILHIMQFYNWGTIKGLYSGGIQLQEIKFITATNRNPLAHLGNVSTRLVQPRDLKLKLGQASDDDIRILSRDAWLLIAQKIGPLPSTKGDSRPSRDRLAAELAITTGMRVNEIAHLKVLEFCQLHIGDDPFSNVALTLTKTKRNKKRKILIPNFLLKEIITYINSERLCAITKSTKRNLRDIPQESLFVNHFDSRRNPGRAISATTLSKAFRNAVIAAGLTEPSCKFNPETGKKYFSTTPKHSFHDLRHTFAINMYYSEIEAGNSEPWKKIQILLGHSQLQTTVDTYLRTVEIEKVNFSKKLYSSIQLLMGH